MMLVLITRLQDLAEMLTSTVAVVEISTVGFLAVGTHEGCNFLAFTEIRGPLITAFISCEKREAAATQDLLEEYESNM